MLDEHYRTVASVEAAAPWTFDGHDASIIGADVWITVIRQVSGLNLTAYGGPADGSVIDCGLDEYDLANGRLIRTWDALSHVPLSLSEEPVGGARHGGGAGAWDAYHLNSVQALPDGDLLVSMRNTWAVYLIDPVNERIVWTLGGKDSTFTPAAGTSFAWQHDARFVDPGHGGSGSDVKLTLFDDDNGGNTENPSEGMVLSLDTVAHTMTLVDGYHHHPPLSAEILGSMQLLPNGNALVGWGSEPFFSEYSSSGRELLDVRFPGVDRSYRALFTDTWVGQPDDPPSGAVRGATVYASWNGATQVTRWEVLAGLKRGQAEARRDRRTQRLRDPDQARQELRHLQGAGAERERPRPWDLKGVLLAPVLPRVHPFEHVCVAVVDDIALDLERRRQLAVVDREVVVEDRELLDLLDLGVVGVGAVELLLDHRPGPPRSAASSPMSSGSPCSLAHGSDLLRVERDQRDRDTACGRRT